MLSPTESSIAGLSVADRVISDDDHDSVDAAIRMAEVSAKQPLVHWAGKDRELSDLDDAIARMRQAGLTNVLIMTGDRVKQEPSDRRVRYLESVPAIVAAKEAWPTMTVAAAKVKLRTKETHQCPFSNVI